MNPLQKLRPLVQLVPAAAVAAVVLLTLPGTEPVLASVPERLTPPVEAASESAAEEEPEEELLPRLPYAAGVYTGSSRGYGGPVKVQVTMADGRITEVQIVSASHETAAFLKRARRLLNTVVTEQSWEVDAISEATYTSRGILGAVRNALTGEVVNNPAPPQPKPAEPLVVEEFTPPSAYRDGVYTASAEGFGGPITVQVTVQNDTITDISILSHDRETTSYFSRARQVVSTILETGTPAGVDAVSGATYSSTGILNAVKSALSKAATDALPEEVPPEETASESEETPASSAEEVLPEETEPAASSQPEEAPAASEPAPEQPTFWEQARDALSALFEDRDAASSSAPAVVFRPAEEAPASTEEAAASDEASSETPEETGESAT